MSDIIVPISRLGNAIEADVEKKVRKIIISVFAALDSASPLGRPELWQNTPSSEYRPGWFKANWRVVVGGIPPVGPVWETTRIVARPDVSKYKAGKGAFIINNAPYAQRLAEGHSQQAPAGWVQAAVRAGVRLGSR